MARQTEIFSIFGHIEGVAAETLIEAGEAIKIDAKDIPAEASLNEHGEQALFAIILQEDKVQKSNDLIASYRA